MTLPLLLSAGVGDLYDLHLTSHQSPPHGHDELSRLEPPSCVKHSVRRLKMGYVCCVVPTDYILSSSHTSALSNKLVFASVSKHVLEAKLRLGGTNIGVMNSFVVALPKSSPPTEFSQELRLQKYCCFKPPNTSRGVRRIFPSITRIRHHITLLTFVLKWC